MATIETAYFLAYHGVVIEKPYLPIEKQIECLKTKGLSFVSEKEAFNILKRHSYYEIINGYSDLFLDSKSPNKHYKIGSSFEEIYNLYCFDFSVRNLMIKFIIKIEKAVKALEIEAYCSDVDSQGKRIHSFDDYLDYSSYDTSSVLKKQSVDELTGRFRKVLKTCKDDAFVHCLNKNNYVPIWVLFTKLTFSEMSIFYESLISKEKSIVSKEFGLFEDDFTTILKILSTFRNVCAHGNRVYCFNCVYDLSKIKLKGNKEFIIEDESKRKFGYVLCCMKFLLSDKDFWDITQNLKCYLQQLFSGLYSIDKKTIYKILGISDKMRTDFQI
jgi:abortive infection bacteriophage resistance protein